MHKAYRKECLLALVAFVAAAAMTHIYPLYFLFPGLTRVELLGFPAHYFLTLVIGWVALMPLYWLYMHLSEKIDREIAEASEPVELEERKVAQGGLR